MPPRRRTAAPAAAANDVTPAPKRGKKAETPEKALQESAAKALQQGQPYVQRVVAYVDEVFKTDTSLDEFLKRRLPDAGALGAAVRELEALFPEAPDVQYAKKLQPGPLLLRPWHLGWWPEMGCKGHLEIETSKCLVVLVAALGFKSNPDRDLGAEKVVVCPSDPHRCSAQPTYAMGKAGLAAGSVALVKGWTRSVALWTFMVSVIDLGITKEELEAANTHDMYATIHATMLHFHTLEDVINANREVRGMCKMFQTSRHLALEPGT